MVVEYPTASEGSAVSFFTVTPQVLCQWKGSIIPKVFPQVLLAVLLAASARWWNPLAGLSEDIHSGMSTMGILLSVLLVFKTQSANGQFWEAISEAMHMLQVSRNIAMSACTYFPFDPKPTANARPDSKLSPADDVLLDMWQGGTLRVRVVAAYALPDAHRRVGRLQTVVRAGDQSFKTEAAKNPLNPVWDSEIFEFTLGQDDCAVTFVVCDVACAGRDSVGWLRLKSTDLLEIDDSQWRQPRYRLEDNDGAELELEIFFMRNQPRHPASGHKTLLATPSARELALKLPSEASTSAGNAAYADCVRSTSEYRMLGTAPFEHVEALPVNAFVRRIVRLVALHFFVLVEYFRRTGGNAIRSKEDQDMMRRVIRTLTGDREYAILYPGDHRGTPGSEAVNASANPRVVLYWLQLTISRCGVVHDIPPPIMSTFVPQLATLADNFGAMDKIDKMQFPLPYTQVVKILCIIFVFVLSPWVLQPKCQDLTELVIGLIALGFFGLDEVAEILESPFGNDPNHIDLWAYGEELMDDLELMYYGREKQLDVVFTESAEGLFDKVERRRRRRSRSRSKAKEVSARHGATRRL